MSLRTNDDIIRLLRVKVLALNSISGSACCHVSFKNTSSFVADYEMQTNPQLWSHKSCLKLYQCVFFDSVLDQVGRFISSAGKNAAVAASGSLPHEPWPTTLSSDVAKRLSCCAKDADTHGQQLGDQKNHTLPCSSSQRVCVFASVCLGRGAINEPLFQILKHSDEPSFVHTDISSCFFLCTHTGICFLHNGFFLIYSLIRIKANKMRARGSELIFIYFFLDLGT